MRILVKILSTCLLLISVQAHAGFHKTTINSRANVCYNNESVTWFWNHWFDWHVISFHYLDFNKPSKGYHIIDTGMVYTWRCAAVHWAESWPGGQWLVVGYHYYKDRGHEVLDGNTQTVDCKFYDGWWDK